MFALSLLHRKVMHANIHAVGELEKMHFNCFPKLGEIKVCELKVFLK
jgi:hypothetical protein